MEEFKEVPKEPGIYLGRLSHTAWLHLIIVVYGTSPFLGIKAWDLAVNVVSLSLDVSHIAGWSKKIADL